MPAKQILLELTDSLIAEGQAVIGTQWAKTHLGHMAIANPTSYVDVQVSLSGGAAA